MAECVYTSKFIPKKEADRLMEVLCGFTSNHQQPQLRHNADVVGRVRISNYADSYDFIQMICINSPEGEDLGNREIAINKFTARMFSKARANTKRKTCYVCGKACSSFCNSHSIPEFTLRHISEKGKVIATLQKEIPMLGKDTGLNKAGTFQLICRECDSKVFR